MNIRPRTLRNPRLWVGWMVLVSGCTAQPPSVATAYNEAPTHAADQQYANLGHQYLLRGSFDLAEVRLQHAIHLNPNLPAAHHDLAVAYGELGNLEAADKEYRIALELLPTDPTVLYHYATLLYNQGRYSEAETRLQAVLATPSAEECAPAYEALGRIALKNQEDSKAEGYFKKTLESAPNSPHSLLALAKINLHKNLLPLAQNYLQRYQSIAHDTPEGLWVGVLLARAQGDDTALAAQSQRLRVKFPDSEEARQLYAERHH